MSWRRAACRTRLSPDGVRAPVQVRGVLAKWKDLVEIDRMWWLGTATRAECRARTRMVPQGSVPSGRPRSPTEPGRRSGESCNGSPDLPDYGVGILGPSPRRDRMTDGFEAHVGVLLLGVVKVYQRSLVLSS